MRWEKKNVFVFCLVGGYCRCNLTLIASLIRLQLLLLLILLRLIKVAIQFTLRIVLYFGGSAMRKLKTWFSCLLLILASFCCCYSSSLFACLENVLNWNNLSTSRLNLRCTLCAADGPPSHWLSRNQHTTE